MTTPTPDGPDGAGHAHIEVHDLSVHFGEGIVALDNVSLSVGHNEFLSIVGPSGCGKSTLLSVIAGLQEPTSGFAAVDGQEIDGPGRDRGVVFQGYTLLPWKTARQNVEFGLLGEKLSSSERREIAMAQLETVGLGEFADVYPDQLSGGMKQRVAIARSLSYKPRVLLMDEPFGALDALTRRGMQELLTKVWEEHRLTVVFVTHDIEEAVYVADRVVVMSPRPGRIRSQHDVPVPRPRTREAMFDPASQALAARILDEIYHV